MLVDRVRPQPDPRANDRQVGEPWRVALRAQQRAMQQLAVERGVEAAELARRSDQATASALRLHVDRVATLVLVGLPRIDLGRAVREADVADFEQLTQDRRRVMRSDREVAGARHDRQRRNACELANRGRPHAARDDHVLGFDHAVLRAHHSDARTHAVKSRHFGAGTHFELGIAPLPEAQHRGARRHRQHHAIALVEQGAGQVVREPWLHVAQLLLVEDVRFVAAVRELLLQDRQQLEVFGLVREVKRAGRVVVKAADLLLQFRPHADAGVRERVLFLGVRGHHEVAHASSRRCARDRTAIEHDDARLRHRGREMQRDRATEDAAPDDDDVCRLRHDHSSPSSSSANGSRS